MATHKYKSCDVCKRTTLSHGRMDWYLPMLLKLDGVMVYEEIDFSGDVCHSCRESIKKLLRELGFNG